MYPHRIRLRGPWECEVPTGAAVRHVALPCEWTQLVAVDFRGSVRLVRPFGYPGRLDDFEHVWLTCSGIRGHAEIALNGQALGSGQGNCEFEITPLLGLRNRLEMTLTVDAPAGAIWEEVALEVRRAAFLRATAQRTGPDSVVVSGVVVGPAGEALELYALLAGRCAHYQVIEPETAGQPFDFTLAGVNADCGEVQLDLVQVATSWYTVAVPVKC
jgi:hypothetical protein